MKRAAPASEPAWPDKSRSLNPALVPGVKAKVPAPVVLTFTAAEADPGFGADTVTAVAPLYAISTVPLPVIVAPVLRAKAVPLPVQTILPVPKLIALEAAALISMLLTVKIRLFRLMVAASKLTKFDVVVKSLRKVTVVITVVSAMLVAVTLHPLVSNVTVPAPPVN